MLNLVKKRKLGTGTIPANLTSLGISWLNGQFKAVSVHRGFVEATWERAGVTDGPEHFDAFIREAVHETGYRGQTVTLVLGHARLVQQLVDLPPVKGKKLQKVIQRQAKQQKMFPGDASWASQACPPGKAAQRMVLHLLPKQLVNHLVLGCKRNGLRLAAIIPPSAVLHQQFAHLGLEKDEVGLLAAETAGSTTLCAGGSDGQILLARTLPGSWNEDPQRLGVDLNRTALFISQQYSAPINRGLWIFGPGAEEKAEALQSHIQLPVDVSPVSDEPFYWATEALKLPLDSIPNLLSRELQEEPQRRIFATAIGVITALMIIASLLASSYFFAQARQEAASIAAMTRDAGRLRATKAELQALDHELSRKKQVIKLILGERPPPVPAWFLAYLSETVPPELVVTNLHIVREEDHYKVQVAGTLQRGLPRSANAPVADPVDVLKAKLAGPPFHLKIAEKQDDKTVSAPAPARSSGPIDTSVPGWLSRLANTVAGRPSTAKPAAQEDHFVIEGIMR
jgi:Tfp pilus assembly protein PilN